MKKIKLFYACQNNNNLGDILGPLIYSNLFGVKCQYALPEKCNTITSGSILEQFLYPHKSVLHKSYLNKVMPAVNVLGSGFISDKKIRLNGKETFLRKMNFYAVRGEKTKKRLEEIIGKKKDMILGDPGLLASELFKVKKNDKKYEIGIIPHYVDKSLIENNVNLRNMKIINICGNAADCITEIAQCNCILSSSLHGLIIADSFGIPNRRIILSDNIIGGDFKFDDYYSIYGVDKHKKIDLRKKKINNDIIEIVNNEYDIPYKSVELIKNQLYKLFSSSII